MNVVILLGAGATLSDVADRPVRERPPLDKGFFKTARHTSPNLSAVVMQYLRGIYGTDELLGAWVSNHVANPNVGKMSFSTHRFTRASGESTLITRLWWGIGTRQTITDPRS